MESDSPLVEVPLRIETTRLVIRRVEDDDAQQLWESADESRGTLLPWLPWVGQYRSIETGRATIARWRREWAERTALPFGIFDRTSGEFLGSVGFVRIDWTVPTFELGYWLRSTAVGAGIMTEAVEALTDLAFDRLEAQRVEIRMDPRNQRSRAVPHRLGFVYEGRMRRVRRDDDGQLRDRDVFSLILADRGARPDAVLS